MKDYARPQPSSRPPRRKKPFITVLIIALAIATPVLMYYVHFQKTIHNKGQILITPIPLPQNTKTPTPKTLIKKTNQRDETQYDFYTLLPKKQ